jgi:hypothetical protein
MAQGRQALSVMDRLSPTEEIAQTIAEYDFGEVLESPALAAELDTVHLVRNNKTGKTEKMTLREMNARNYPEIFGNQFVSTAPLDVDMELTTRQAQRSRVEPAGSTEQFTVDDQMLSGKIGQLMAQAGRRAGKRRNR